MDKIKYSDEALRESREFIKSLPHDIKMTALQWEKLQKSLARWITEHYDLEKD